MFNGKLIKRLEDENSYLRDRIRTLEEKLIALCDKGAYWDLKTAEDAPKAPQYVDPMGMVNSLEAKTETEKREKEMARDQINMMFTGATITK